MNKVGKLKRSADDCAAIAGNARRRLYLQSLAARQKVRNTVSAEATLVGAFAAGVLLHQVSDAGDDGRDTVDGDERRVSDASLPFHKRITYHFIMPLAVRHLAGSLIDNVPAE